MSIAFSFNPASYSYSPFSSSSSSSKPNTSSFSARASFRLRLSLPPVSSPYRIHHRRDLPFVLHSSGGDNGGHGSFGGHGGGGHGGGDEDGNAGDNRKNEAILVLAEAGRSLESVPSDLAAAIKDGKIPASVVSRFLELEKSPFLRWLLQFGGFKERLLADDLFLAKVGMECGVGVFTKV